MESLLALTGGGKLLAHAHEKTNEHVKQKSDFIPLAESTISNRTHVLGKP